MLTRQEFDVNSSAELATVHSVRVADWLADLPGGKHPRPGDDWLLDRIPESRVAMFRNIDRFIVLGRRDRPDIIPTWQQALADRGCDGRILAELTSESPDSQPECLQLQRTGPLLRARMRGLDRNHPREQIAAALTDFTAHLIDILPIRP